MSKYVEYVRFKKDGNHIRMSEGMLVAQLLICILISLVADECNSFSFDTMFTYITIAIQLYEACLQLQKNYKEHKQKTFQNTNDIVNIG